MTTDELLAVLRIVGHGVAGDTDAVQRCAYAFAAELECDSRFHAAYVRRAATVTQSTDWIKRLRIEDLQEPKR